jgi:hypothetical protein
MPTRVGRYPLGEIDKLETSDANGPTDEKIGPIDPGIGREILTDDAARFAQGELARNRGGSQWISLEHVGLKRFESNQVAEKLMCRGQP